MKTLLVVTPYFPPHPGGVENYVYMIGKELQKMQWRVVVVTSTNNKSRIESFDGFKVYYLPKWFRISNTPINPLWRKKLELIIREENPDIINAHTPVPFMADVAAMAAGSIPFVITYHAGENTIKRGHIIDALTNVYQKKIIPILLSRADKIISSSKYAAATILSKYKNKTIIVTPGVNEKLFRPAKGKKSHILFVGSLNKAEHYKDLETLLEACAILKKNSTEVFLTVVGEGDYRSNYEKIVRKLNISENVIFRGRITGTTLVKEYQQCTLLAHPSIFDSCPTVVLEAMSCGKPVIVANTSGLPYMIKKNKTGLFFTPQDPDSLAKCIQKVMANNNLRKRLGKNARKEILSHYTWKPLARRTNDLLKNTIRAKGQS